MYWKLQIFCYVLVPNQLAVSTVYHHIREVVAQRCVQINELYNKNASGEIAEVRSCRNSTEQKIDWEFREVSKTEYNLIWRTNGKCLTVSGEFKNQAYIIQKDCKVGDKSQIWTVFEIQGTTPMATYIKALRGGHWCLTVFDGCKMVHDGVRMEIYECLGVRNQQFILEPPVKISKGSVYPTTRRINISTTTQLPRIGNEPTKSISTTTKKIEKVSNDKQKKENQKAEDGKKNVDKKTGTGTGNSAFSTYNILIFLAIEFFVNLVN